MRVIVTGAAGGIGSAIVKLFLAKGYDVVGCDQTTPYAAVAGQQGTFTPYVVDLADAVACGAFLAEVWATAPVDILVNAAGVFAGGPAQELSLAAWDQLFNINTRAVFLLATDCGQRMAARGTGSIVTVASNSAVLPRAGMVAYGASKAAASLLTRSLGLELGPAGVRCNVVNPGTTRTKMIHGLGTEAQFVAGFPASFKTGIPLGKIAEPADIAAAVFFAATQPHLTCQEINVDGGASAR